MKNSCLHVHKSAFRKPDEAILNDLEKNETQNKPESSFAKSHGHSCPEIEK